MSFVSGDLYREPRHNTPVPGTVQGD